MKKICLYAVALSFWAMSGLTNAAALQWNLQDVAFENGEIATGSFMYEASTNTYSSASITITSSPISHLNRTWTDVSINPAVSSSTTLYFISTSSLHTDSVQFSWDTSSPLNESGGIRVLSSDVSNIRHTNFESGVILTQRSYVVSGSLVAVTPVPEPEIYAMMLAGLGIMGWAARRRKQRQAAV